MDQYRDRIAIEFISALGMPPVEYVELASGLGCRYIGIALEPIVAYSKAYPSGRCVTTSTCDVRRWPSCVDMAY